MAYVYASWFMCISFCVARFRLMLYLSLCFAFHVYAGTLCFMFMLTRIVMSTLYVSVYACFMLIYGSCDTEVFRMFHASRSCSMFYIHWSCGCFIVYVYVLYLLFYTYVVCYILV